MDQNTPPTRKLTINLGPKRDLRAWSDEINGSIPKKPQKRHSILTPIQNDSNLKNQINVVIDLDEDDVDEKPTVKTQKPSKVRESSNYKWSKKQPDWLREIPDVRQNGQSISEPPKFVANSSPMLKMPVKESQVPILPVRMPVAPISPVRQNVQSISYPPKFGPISLPKGITVVKKESKAPMSPVRLPFPKFEPKVNEFAIKSNPFLPSAGHSFGWSVQNQAQGAATHLLTQKSVNTLQLPVPGTSGSIQNQAIAIQKPISKKNQKAKRTNDKQLKALQARMALKGMQSDVLQLENELQVDQDDKAEDQMGVADTYADYKPAKLKFGQPHPDPVVETASLSSVEPTDITYELKIPKRVINKGALSALQLESIVYASQAHQHFLGNEDRAGFLIGKTFLRFHLYCFILLFLIGFSQSKIS